MQIRSKDEDVLTIHHWDLSKFLQRASSDVTIDVSTRDLKECIRYMEYHHGKPIPTIKSPLSLEIGNVNIKDSWDLAFVKEVEDIYSLTKASSVLEIDDLTKLCCSYVAFLLKRKNSSL